MEKAKQPTDTLEFLLKQATQLLSKAPSDPHLLPNEWETWVCNTTGFLDYFITYAKRTIRK